LVCIGLLLEYWRLEKHAPVSSTPHQSENDSPYTGDLSKCTSERFTMDLNETFFSYFGVMCIVLGALYGLGLAWPALGAKLYREHLPATIDDPQRKRAAYIRAVMLVAMFANVGGGWLAYASTNTSAELAMAAVFLMMGLACGIASAYYRRVLGTRSGRRQGE
jgi:hypothetical protein